MVTAEQVHSKFPTYPILHHEHTHTHRGQHEHSMHAACSSAMLGSTFVAWQLCTAWKAGTCSQCKLLQVARHDGSAHMLCHTGQGKESIRAASPELAGGGLGKPPYSSRLKTLYNIFHVSSPVPPSWSRI